MVQYKVSTIIVVYKSAGGHGTSVPQPIVELQGHWLVHVWPEHPQGWPAQLPHFVTKQAGGL